MPAAMVQHGASLYIEKAGVKAFLSTQLELVHLESLADDMKRLYLWMGCDPERAEPEMAAVMTRLSRFFSMPSRHVNYPGKSSTNMSEIGRRTLRQCLIQRAINGRLKGAVRSVR